MGVPVSKGQGGVAVLVLVMLHHYPSTHAPETTTIFYDTPLCLMTPHRVLLGRNTLPLINSGRAYCIRMAPQNFEWEASS